MNLLNSPFKPFFVASSEFDPTESKLLRFGLLRDGWCYGAGMAFHPQAIHDALIIHRQIFFKGYTSTDAFPGPSGEIQVTTYVGDHYFQFERESSGLWNIAHEIKNEEQEFLPRQHLSQVCNYINSLDAKLCATSAVFTEGIGMPGESNSITWHSNLWTGEFPSWTPHACQPPGPAFANTSKMVFPLPPQRADNVLGICESDEIIPSHAVFKKTLSDKGDTCHYEISNLHRKEEKKISYSITLDSVRACDNGNMRSAAISDFSDSPFDENL